VALFFLAASLVFILARWFGRRTKHDGGIVSLLPCFWAAIVVGGLSLFWALLAAWINAREAHSRDAIAAAIRALSSLENYQSAELIGGALAGIILYDGFRRTQEMSAESEGALKNSAIVVLPAALFLAVALLSRDGVLERIVGLEAGGMKVALQPLERASKRDEIVPSQSLTTNGERQDEVFPNIAALLDLTDPDKNRNMIQRDYQIILRLAGPNQNLTIQDNVFREYGQFLGMFRSTVLCLDNYIKKSNDTRLVAIAGVNVPLAFVVLERAIRERQSDRSLNHARKLLDTLRKNEEQLQEAMGSYMDGFQNGENNKCQSSQGSPAQPDPASSADKQSDDKPPHILLDGVWKEKSDAPYITLAAAWLGAAYKEPSMSARLLTEWLADKRNTLAPEKPDVTLAWLRVRTLIELIIILPSTFGRPEPASARAALEVAVGEFEALPSLPRLEHYARTTVRSNGSACPKIHDSPDPLGLDANLFLTRASLLARMLLAVVDNPDPANRLKAHHMRLATALRDADLACFPSILKPYDSQAWSAVFQITYARVARAWAAEPVVSREQARELQKEAENTLRMGLHELEAAQAKWREAQERGDRRDLTNLFQNYPFRPILETARRFSAGTPR
jgi:cell division protein ZapA (FtsZ GTPase activity inhibitor)